MSRVSLSDTGDYQLVNDEQDVRGYNVVDQAGQPVGVVESMVVDTDAELVTTLVLEDGTELAARDVTIGENVVYVDRSGAGQTTATSADFGDLDDVDAGAPTTAATIPTADLAGAGMAGSVMGAAPDYGRVTRREHVANVNESFDTDFDEFQEHHAATYGAAGRTYDDDAAAYRHGYASAHDDAHRNRSFGDAEADLRSTYPADRDFDADREAVRYGYGRAQRRPRSNPS